MISEAKIQEVFNDEAFVKNLLGMEKPEEVQTALQEKDIDLSLEAIASMKENLIKKLNGESVDPELQAPSDEAVTLIAIITVVAVVVSAAAATTSATVSVATFVDSITQHKW